MQGHTFSAVCRLAVGNFDTPEVQAVMDGSSTCRVRGKTRPINHEQFTVVLFYVFFVPYIVLQLCNVTNKCTLLKLKFLFSSSRLLHVSNITCPSPGRPLVRACSFCGMFFMYLYKKSSRWKEVLDIFTVVMPCRNTV